MGAVGLEPTLLKETDFLARILDLHHNGLNTLSLKSVVAAITPCAHIVTYSLVPGVGLEPTSLWAEVFETSEFTNFSIRAY